MILDITKLDKILLIRALYDMASPAGYGSIEYGIKKTKGYLVNDISESMCGEMLKAFNDYKDIDPQYLKSNVKTVKYGKGFDIADYINGKPIKLHIYRPYGDYNKIYVYPFDYDYSNEIYLFLETLIKHFPLKDFKIVKKYKNDDLKKIKEYGKKPINDVRYKDYKILVKNLLVDGTIDINIIKKLDYFKNLIS